MKFKSLLLLLAIFGVTAAKANTDPKPSSPTPGNGGKKNNLMGVVSHAENKKPLKNVNVTAYLVSKKEKAVTTDQAGVFSFDELKPGTYKFIFEKEGYKRVTKDNIVIKPDEGCELNIEMMQTKDYNLVPSPLHFMDM